MWSNVNESLFVVQELSFWGFFFSAELGAKIGVYALSNPINLSVYLKFLCFFLCCCANSQISDQTTGCRRQTASNFHILSFAFPRRRLRLMNN